LEKAWMTGIIPFVIVDLLKILAVSGLTSIEGVHLKMSQNRK